MWWYSIIGFVVLVLLVAWIANSARLARRNRNLGRRGTGMLRHGEGELDERNRQTNQPPVGPYGSTEPQPRPAAPELDPYYEGNQPPSRPASPSRPEQRP